MPAEVSYRGRFAPSPTGPLHFGSLVAAVASYADALANNGEWLVRIEDLDPTREQADAEARIIDTLFQHGMVFPGPVRQSERCAVYNRALNNLLGSAAAYPCSCTRKTLTATASRGVAGLIYPGTCRVRAAPADSNAVRFKCGDERVTFQDAIQGTQTIALRDEVGDFLLRRGDGYFAYQLAVAVDDNAQGITHVLRGTDLLNSTFMQIAVLQQLNLGVPQYAHFPVVVGPDGRKLSKQTKARPVDNKNIKNNIFSALCHLQQEPPTRLRTAPVNDIWSWTAEHWTLSKLYAVRCATDNVYD